MRITKLRRNHVKELMEFNSEKFPFPDLDNPLYVIRGSVVDDNDRLIGAGFIKLTSEAILILDPSLNKVVKSTAIMKLFEGAVKGATKKGLDGMHVFLYNMPIYSRFLQKRFGFVKVAADEVLYLRF